MDGFQTFILLMFAAAILVGISQKINFPYPICLVLGGVAIGFTPIKQVMYFDPNLILLIVLPPILYYAAFGISFREFKHSFKNILSLALGLVAFNTFIIGLIFKWIFPEFPWALAFAFGAIVSPPDAIAATTILKRFTISNRLLTILEGESLINDASAIVLYRMAVTALLSESFSLSAGTIDFFKIVTGGIFVGYLLGYLTQHFSRKYLTPTAGVVFSFTIPYITYLLADSLQVSGVLAVVVNGLMGSQILLRHHSSLRRILGYVAWDIFIILMNCFVFILIGLQLPALTNTMTMNMILIYTADAIAITFAMILVRMFWVYISYFKVMQKRKAVTISSKILKESAIISWSGMRGIVSLTAALALPYGLEGRTEVIFITFIVILLTLILPGLTLSPLIRWLKMDQQEKENQLDKIRKELTKVSEETINHLQQQHKINNEESEYLKALFNLKTRLIEITSSEESKLKNLESVKNLILQEQRKKLVEIWERVEIDDKLLNEIEQELDLEEIHMARAELS